MRVAVLGYARGGLRNRLDKGNRPPSLSAARKQSCDLAKEKRSNGESGRKMMVVQRLVERPGC